MKKSIFCLIDIVLTTLLFSCCNPARQQEGQFVPERRFITNATLLEIDTIGKATACLVHNPWQPGKYLGKYLLLPADPALLPADSAAALRERYPDYIPLSVPLQRMTLTNGCHVYLMKELNALDNVAAMCDGQYALVPELKERLKDGTIIDAGAATSPNIEKLLATRTDAIWIPPFENAGAGAFGRFGIPIIYCADYMEPHPLSRAEWMKFYGRLVGRGHEADSLFQLVKYHYRAIADLCIYDKEKPTVLSEYTIGDTWTVPAGRSTTSRLYRDAGGTYIWGDDNHTGSLTLSTEAVFTKARNADYWFITYRDTTFAFLNRFQFQELNPIHIKFRACRYNRVYSCNTLYTPYFEEAPFRPDQLLWGVRRILHQDTPYCIIFEEGDTLVDPFYFYPVIDLFDLIPPL